MISNYSTYEQFRDALGDEIAKTRSKQKTPWMIAVGYTTAVEEEKDMGLGLWCRHIGKSKPQYIQELEEAEAKRLELEKKKPFTLEFA